jgi:hypothetical protein
MARGKGGGGGLQCILCTMENLGAGPATDAQLGRRRQPHGCAAHRAALGQVYWPGMTMVACTAQPAGNSPV